MSAYFGLDSLPECEKMVECPFNKAHLVVQHRMANHIVKCRKNQEIYGVKECRFNSSHILPLCEIKSHEATCPDRVVIESFIKHRMNQPQSSGVSSTSRSTIKKCDDDWDSDTDASYKPFHKR
ncbi:gametocyte-specific factor 1-like [Chironomus tepperi]|uniref:gametocyte-specific factor 1-like n=1 Tax=Chironomus tepperi TaxID=113505 RepID=UPI00391EFDEF